MTIREWWSLGNGPINDLQYILEENGLIVTGVSLSDRKIDAYSQIIDINGNETYIIVLSIGKKRKSKNKL